MLNNAITLQSDSRINGSGKGTLNGIISGNYALTTNATSTTLAGANTYSGATLASGGTLNLFSSTALGSTSGITVNSGVTLSIANASALQGIAGVINTGGTLDINNITLTSLPLTLSSGIFLTGTNTVSISDSIALPSSLTIQGSGH